MSELADDDDPTPVNPNPCPDCGNTAVKIGLSVPPPGTLDIWTTIFSQHCVIAPDWRWCYVQGHLSIWPRKPPPVADPE